jgi:hypothetical protein
LKLLAPRLVLLLKWKNPNIYNILSGSERRTRFGNRERERETRAQSEWVECLVLLCCCQAKSEWESAASAHTHTPSASGGERRESLLSRWRENFIDFATSSRCFSAHRVRNFYIYTFFAVPALLFSKCLLTIILLHCAAFYCISPSAQKMVPKRNRSKLTFGVQTSK